MFELVLWAIGWLFYGLFYGVVAAPIGLLYPPKSPDWAFRQKVGWILGAATLACFAAAIITAWIAGWSAALWIPIGAGLAGFVAFSIIGNSCRAAHE